MPKKKLTRYAIVWVSIWNDSKFLKLSNYAKLLFFYLLTSQHQTMLGLLPLNQDALAAVCGLPKARFKAAFTELLTNGFISYDVAGLVWVRHFQHHNPPANPNVAMKWGGLIGLFPECRLLQEAIESARIVCSQRGPQYLDAFDAARGGMGNSSLNRIANGCVTQKQNQQPEQRQEQQVASDTTGESNGRIPFPYRMLPDAWRLHCQTTRPDVNAEVLFEKMHRHFTVGEGAKELCTQAEWAHRWEAWVKKEHVSVLHSEQSVPVTYDTGISADGSF